MKKLLILSLWICAAQSMENPGAQKTMFDRLGWTPEQLEHMRTQNPQLAELVEGLKKVSAKTPSSEFYTVPNVPEESVDQYWAQLQHSYSDNPASNFPWGSACAYAINHNDAYATIIARYGKSIVAKAHANRIAQSLHGAIQKQEMLKAQAEIDSDVYALAYVFTGDHNTRIMRSSHERWKAQLKEINSYILSNLPIADAY
jgi:hypothetical protein